MSPLADMNGGPPEVAAPPPHAKRPARPAIPRGAERSYPLDLISCDGCGRSFVTLDGPGMIAAIKGPCPDCGGRFGLASTS